MKKYRCAYLDFDIKADNKKLVWMKFANGLKEARRLCNIPVSYNNNCKCFTGWKGNKNYIISEV